MTSAYAVALFPTPTGEPGEYLTLLRDALGHLGIHCAPVPALNARWARAGTDTVGVVHLHWLEFIAPSDRSPRLGAVKTSRRAMRLCLALWTLQRRGIAIVWTIHNLAPHEPVHPRLERMLQRLVLRVADAAIVHSNHARARVAQRLGHERKLHLVPHGNYLGVYPPPSESDATLRSALGIAPDAFVYLSFGQVRAYKRLGELLDAFRSLPGDGLALLIAGEPRDPREEERVRSLAAQDPRVTLDLRRIPIEEVAGLHQVADAAVFAYEHLFSSGSVLLALSYGLPAVVPAGSTGTEIADPPAIEPIGPDGLTAALSAVRSGNQQFRRNAAIAAAARYDWREVGRQTMQVYELARERRRARGSRF